jgi:hypothetical protein
MRVLQLNSSPVSPTYGTEEERAEPETDPLTASTVFGMIKRYRVHPLKAALLFPPLATLVCVAMAILASPSMKFVFVALVLAPWLRAVFAYADVSDGEILIRPYYLSFEGGLRRFAWADLTGAAVIPARPAVRRILEFRSGDRSARVPLFALADPRAFLDSVTAHIQRDDALGRTLAEIAESLR